MYLDDIFGLKKKVAVVTGGGRGIGQTIFANGGYTTR